MADIIPYNFQYQEAIGTLNFNTNVFKVALYGGAFTSACLVVANTYNDLSANELPNGFGYETGGKVTSTSAYMDGTNFQVVYDCDDVSWTASGGPIGAARYAALYECCNSQTVVYVFDFGASKTAYDGSQMNIKIDSNGLFRKIQRKCN